MDHTTSSLSPLCVAYHLVKKLGPAGERGQSWTRSVSSSATTQRLAASEALIVVGL
jgi:hypothetical protein